MIANVRRRLVLLVIALMIDAGAGMALGTVAGYDHAHPSTIHSALLWGHIIVAIGVILGGIVQVVFSLMKRRLRAPSIAGFISALAAFASGGMVVDGDGKTAVFSMAIFFLVALACYGFALVQLNEKEEK